MLKRRLKLLGRILLAVLVLFFAFLLFERFRGRIALAQYRRALIRNGEKLSPEDFRLNPSPADNGATAVAEAIERLKEGDVLPKHYPPRMQLTVSGRAVVGFRENAWGDGKVTNHWDQLAADLKTNEVTLAALRQALVKPVFDNQLDLAQGMKLQFTHLSRGITLAHWFSSGTQLALREGRLQDASRELVVEIGLPRLMAEDRLVISELVRMAIAAVAKTDTWEALQADGWKDEDLIAIQEAWGRHDFAGDMARSLEGERIYCDATSESLRASNEDTFGLLFSEDSQMAAAMTGAEFEPASRNPFLESLPFGVQMADFVRKQIYCRVWRFSWSHQDQVRTAKNLQALMELARIGAQDNSYSATKPALDKLFSEIGDKNFYDRLRYPGPDPLSALSRTILRAMQTETDRSLALCAIALKRYSLRHGKLPVTLETLVPEFLPSVPRDHMDGKPAKYRLNPDGSFRLYSVGEDEKDDGGDATLLDDKKGIRSLWARKDYVWPLPASSEEVAAYRKDSAKE